MLSITRISWGTYLGTSKAANGVFAGGSSATTTFVCCTFIDVCRIMNNSFLFVILKQHGVAHSLLIFCMDKIIITDYSELAKTF